MILRMIPAIVFTAFVASREEASLSTRISQRDFPSVFQAWNAASPAATADATAMLARHDLVFLHPSMMGLNSGTACEGTAFDFAPAEIAEAKARRAAFLAKNPRLILLAEIRYRDAPKGFIPEEAPQELLRELIPFLGQGR